MKTYSLAVFLLVAVVAGWSRAQCEEGWVSIQDRCYALLQTVATDWAGAQDACVGLGADTAIVDDADILKSIFDYIVDYDLSGSFWLGASDESAEGNWLWRTNVRVTHGTPFWGLHKNLLGGYSQEPQGGEDENCLALAEDLYYYLDDRNCSELNFPLCQSV